MSAKSISLVLSVIALALLSLAYRSQKLHANKLEQQVSLLQHEQAKQLESSDAQVTLLRKQLERQQSLVQELAQLRGISASYRHLTNEFARLQKEHGQLVGAVKEQAVA